MKLAIASDHGGLDLKNHIVDYLTKNRADITIIDLGTNSNDSVNYPEFGKKMAQTILDGTADQGILICGTGIGISMAANRFKGIRAALVYNEETAEMASAHNHANVLCLGGRTTSPELAADLVVIWLNTEFEGGRHQKRLDMLDA